MGGQRAVVAGGLVAVSLAVGAGWSFDARAAGFETARFGESREPSSPRTRPRSITTPRASGSARGRTSTSTARWRSAARRGPTRWLRPTRRIPPGGEGANAGTARLFNVFGGPALGATTRLGNFALGAGLFVPFGGRESWQQNKQFLGSPYPLAADRRAAVARHRRGPDVHLRHGRGGLSARPAEHRRRGERHPLVGLVLPGQEHGGLGTPDTARGAGDAERERITGSFGAGAMLEAVPGRLWLAASYQSQPGMGPNR